MPYSIICFTKILTLAIAPFLFILVDILCEFAIVPVVYILLSPQEEENTVLPEGTDAHIQEQIHQKDLHLFLPLFYYAKLIVELENTNKELNCVMLMVLVI